MNTTGYASESCGARRRHLSNVWLTVMAVVLVATMSASGALAATITASWDWQNKIPSGIRDIDAIEGGTGTIASDVDGVTLYVDATHGKLAPNGNNAQFNAGTVLHVPVVSTSDVVTVVGYSGLSHYYYGNASDDEKADESTYTATLTDVARGYVAVTASAHGYLFGLKVEQHRDDALTPTAATVAWAFDAGTSGQTAAYTVDNVFKSNSVDMVGGEWSCNGTTTLEYDNVSTTYTKVLHSGTKLNSNDNSQYIDFVVTPKNGVCFVPSAVSFYALRTGTNGGLIDYAIIGDDEKVLATGIAPKRDNSSDNDGVHFESTITDKVVCSKSAPCKLRIYVYSLDPNKNICLSNVLISGTYVGTPSDVPTKTVTTVINPTGAGKIKQVPDGTDVDEGSEVTFTATAEYGYKFSSWTLNSGTIGTASDNVYTISSLNANTTLTASFTALPKVTFSKGSDADVLGSAPVFDASGSSYDYADPSLTIPVNHTLYKEGYTLTGWTDGTNTYAVGGTITPSGDVTLTPVFTVNAKSIADRQSAVIVKVDLQRRNGAPKFDLGSNTEGFYVVQSNVDGATIDVKVGFNTKSGKLANGAWTDWCQLNGGFEFYLPSCPTAIVTMETYVASSATTIDGVALTGNTSTTPEYTVASDNDPITVVMGGDHQYFRWIQIRLPKVDIAASDLAIVSGKETVAVDAGSTYTLTKDVDYTTTSAGAITYTTSDATVATVAADGTVTGMNAGTATITMTQAYDNLIASKSVQYTVNVSYSTAPVVVTDLNATYNTKQTRPVTLEVAVAGASSYQWFESSANSYTGTAIEGATTNSYTHPATNIGKKYYYCEITNDKGTTRSAIAAVNVASLTHTFDFTNWSNATKTNLAADTEAWSLDEKGNGSGIMTGAYFNVAGATGMPAAGEKLPLKANGTYISELYPLSFSGSADGAAQRGNYAIAYDLAVTQFNNKEGEEPYAGNNYLWIGKANTSIVIPNVKAGSTLYMGVESHNTYNGAEGEARGFTLYCNGSQIEGTGAGTDFVPRFYTDASCQIPDAAVLGSDYVDVTVKSTKSAHIYYIDCDYNDFMLLTSTLSMKGAGTEYQLTKGTDYTTSSSATLTFATDAAEVATVDADGKITATGTGTAHITITVPAHDDLPALVKTITVTSAPTATLTYSLGDSGAEGVTPAATTVDIGDKVTVNAQNKSVYKAGYTLTGWTDGTTTYEQGDKITLNDDLTLTPVFRQNTKSLLDNTAPISVKWPMAKADGAFEYSNGGAAVVQAEVAGETIDFGIVFTSALNNDNDGWMKPSGGTFTIPVVQGALITARCYYGSEREYIKVNGETVYGTMVEGNNIIEYTYNGNASTVDVQFGQFLNYIQVSYPSLPVITTNLDDSYVVRRGTSKALVIASNNATSYQWYSSTSATNVGGTPIEGATSATYSFVTNDQTEPGDYYFYCVATNGIGSTASTVATVTVVATSAEHTFDFTNWSSVTTTALAADTEKWRTTEKADGKGNMGGWYLNTNISGERLTANGSVVNETSPLVFSANSGALALNNDLASTSIGTYHGSQYMWMFDKSSFVIPNVVNGSALTMGFESHSASENRGFNIFYGDAKTDTWVALDTCLTKEFRVAELTIPIDASASGYTDVKIEANKHFHLYYIDCQYNDFEVLADPVYVSTGGTYTLTRGVDYESTSTAGISFSVEDESVATVDEDGKLTARGTGSTTLSYIIGEHDGLPAFIATTTVLIVNTSDLAIMPGKSKIELITDTKMSEGETYQLTKNVDYTTSSDGALTYSSSNEQVATVSADGLVTVVSGGTASITVSQAVAGQYSAGQIVFTIETSNAADVPTVTSDIPDSLTIYTYTSTKLAVTAVNAMTYQWYTCDDREMTNAQPIPGATKPEYYMRSTVPGTTYYYCRLTNSQGSIVSEICKVNAVRKIVWNFEQTVVKDDMEPTLWSEIMKNGKPNGYRLSYTAGLSNSEVMQTPELPLSLTEGLFFTVADGGTFVVGYEESPENYHRLQLADKNVTLRIPGCEKDEVIVIDATWTTKNKGLITPSVNVKCVDTEVESYQPLTSLYEEYKLVVLEDGDVEITLNGASMHRIEIISAHPVVEQTYSAVAVASNDESKILTTYVADGKAWTDATVEVPYSFWLKDTEGNLYKYGVKDQPKTGRFNISSDTTFVIKYEPTDVEHVVFLSEGEDIKGTVKCTNGNAAIRSSMNAAAYTEKDIKVTRLPAGTYKIRAIVFDAAKNPASQHTFVIGDNVVTLSATATNWTEAESEQFTLYRETDVVWMQGGDGNAGIDILAIYDTAVPVAAEPVITVNEEDHTFTLSTTEDGASIYYTVNGQTPDESVGILYDGTPVQLSCNVTIKAVTIAPERMNSAVAITTTKYEAYKINASALPKKYGIVTLSPESSDGKYFAGAKVKMQARAKAGYGFVGWQRTTTGALLSTDVAYEVTVSANASENVYYAVFRTGEPGHVHYDINGARFLRADGTDNVDYYKEQLGDLETAKAFVASWAAGINGKEFFPADTVVTAISIPQHYALRASGYTLLHWEEKDNAENKFELGSSRLFETEGEEITLVPVFIANPGSTGMADMASDLLEKRTETVGITWDFRTGYGAHALELRGDYDCGEYYDEYVGGQNVSRNYGYPYMTHATFDSQRNGVTFNDATVDVNMYINTAEGSFTNKDIDTWAYMSEGTRLIIPSGYGAVVTLATRYPILDDEDGTRINGHMPDNIYNEEIPRTAEGGYLYKWTVDSAAQKAVLRIGSDYSYYQYLHVDLPNAQIMSLDFSTNNGGMGTVKAVTTPMSIGNDGSYSYSNGTEVKLKAVRSRYYELKYWLDAEGTKIFPDGHYEKANGYVSDVYSGNFDTGTDIHYTEVRGDSITFALNNHHSLQAVFGEKTSYYVDFSAGGEAEGLPPYQQRVEWDEDFVMPSHNQQLYFDGHTLDYYYDETEANPESPAVKYLFGGSYRTTRNIRLMPHFHQNTKEITSVTTPTTVTWPLAVAEGATEINYNRSAGLIVGQLYFEGDSIDLPCYIDGNSGYAINTTDETFCSVASGCVMTVPTVTGCSISINAVNANFVNTQIAGTSSQNLGRTEAKYTAGKTATVTYTGSDAQEQIKFRDARQCTWIKVTYPMMTDKPELTRVSVNSTDISETDFNTLLTTGSVTVSVKKPDYSKDVVATVKAYCTDGGETTVTQPTSASPKAVIALDTESGIDIGTYTVNFSFTELTAPELKSVTVQGKAATANGSTTVSGAPVNGVVALTFDHAMLGTKLNGTDAHGLNMTEDDGVINAVASTTPGTDGNTYKLLLTYWGLSQGQHTLTIPAGTFSDAYGVAYDQPITVKFSVVNTSSDVAQQRFNFIVTHDKTWDAETQTAGQRVQIVSDDVIENLNRYNDVKYGTLDEGIALAEAAGSGDRFYIFVPNGEYSMKGNQARTGTFNETKNGNNQNFKVTNYYNGETWINRSNLSIIGQSKDKTVIYNDPFIYGISYTSTLELRRGASNCYFQDFTLDNRYSKYQVERGDANPGGQAVALYDRAQYTVMKNVALKGYQDTYTSGGTTSGSATSPGCYKTYRYYEDCDVWGTVDFLCGMGDDWWERPTIVLRKRVTANNIVAPNHIGTSISKNYQGADYMFEHRWGYVYNKGVVKCEDAAAYNAQNGKWTLGRPWQNSPACTFLNMQYMTEPLAGGWSNMTGTKVIRMHEYGTLDSYGNPADLTQRTLRASTPAAGSDDCIMTKEQADEYTLHNVLGGETAYDPTIYTEQVSMKGKSLHHETNTAGREEIVWTPAAKAMCYFIFRIDKQSGDTLFYDMTTEPSYLPDEDQAGEKFLVRAANERGGLGAPSDIITYTPLSTYTVEVKQVGSDSEMGWSTVCLPVNTIFRDDIDNFNVYAAVGVSGSTLVLKKLTSSDGMRATRGYIIFAKPGTYTFYGTYNDVRFKFSVTDASNSYDGYSILDGNPENEAVGVGTLNVYTMSYKPAISSEVGFYKFVGSQIPAHKAYLLNEYVGGPVNMDVASGAKGFGFIIIDDDEEWATGISNVSGDSDAGESVEVFDLSGKRVDPDQMRKGMIYIIGGQKILFE